MSILKRMIPKLLTVFIFINVGLSQNIWAADKAGAAAVAVDPMVEAFFDGAPAAATSIGPYGYGMGFLALFLLCGWVATGIGWATSHCPDDIPGNYSNSSNCTDIGEIIYIFTSNCSRGNNTCPPCHNGTNPNPPTPPYIPPYAPPHPVNNGSFANCSNGSFPICEYVEVIKYLCNFTYMCFFNQSTLPQ